MLDHSSQVQRHKHVDRGLDCYETPPVAVHALLKQESLPSKVWEPAAGRGAIAKVLRDYGIAVICSDIHAYPEFDLHFRNDFLLERAVPVGVQAIVTNPPFMLAHQFVRHALELCPRVIMLARLAFYESERRADIFDGRLARVYAFSNRLPMMHRDKWAGRKANSGMAFAWFSWDRNHTGPTEIRRISWKESTDTSKPTELSNTCSSDGSLSAI